jgi:hypothetical protein
MSEIGYETGEICNRDGCNGIIAEHQKEGSCSCHINPPCGYCTTDAHYCPECDWSAEEEQNNNERKPSEAEIEYYKKENDKWQKRRDSFYDKYAGKIPITELETRTELHTHFTQIVRGVFPEGTKTKEEIEQQVQGSFGGRFTHFSKNSFEYIAYTD